jgi:arylsulfatase A-like enzyme
MSGSDTTRRHFLGAAAASLAMIATSEARPEPQRSRRGERPNILFLFSDDQRFDTIGALGNPYIDTPNLDRLVRRGTAFTHAHIMGSTSPAVCAPSRAMLLTGRGLFHLPESFAVPWSGSGQPGESPYITFPEHFRAAGYTTFVTGKWHNERPALMRGFSDGGAIFFGGMADHLATPVHEFDSSGKYPRETAQAGDAFSSELFSDAAIRFLEGYSDSVPFMMYVSYTAPHDPRMAPEPFASRYRPNEIPLPPNYLPEHPFDNGELRIRDEELAPFPRTPEIVREHIAAYYAMISHLDAQIGRVLEALDRTGHARDTIIVFAGDNGLAVGQHGLLGKQNLYEHSIRVPLVLAGPGIPEGEQRDALVYLHDLFPTFCDLAGLDTPDSVEGLSLARTLTRPKEAVRDSIYYVYRDFQRGVRRGAWKLLRYDVNGQPHTQLFNLEQDPYELRNLAADPAYSDQRRELEELLAEQMRQHSDPAAANPAYLPGTPYIWRGKTQE